jgi:hypothetical protein
MAFFLTLAAFQSTQSAKILAHLLMALGVLAPLSLVFWLASRR